MRAARRLTNLLTPLSLVLCVATAALWPASQYFCLYAGCQYTASDRAYHFWRTSIFTGLAAVTLDVFSFPREEPGAFTEAVRRGELKPGFDASVRRFGSVRESQWRTESRWTAGLPYYSRFEDLSTIDLGGRPGAVLHRWTLRVPLWCFAILFAIAPARGAVRRVARARRGARGC